jgi:hypothetical protein
MWGAALKSGAKRFETNVVILSVISQSSEKGKSSLDYTTASSSETDPKPWLLSLCHFAYCGHQIRESVFCTSHTPNMHSAPLENDMCSPDE